MNAEKRAQLQAIISEEKLKPGRTLEFMKNSFECGYVPEVGLEPDSIMPPLNPFDKKANRAGKIQQVLQRLKAFFSKFCPISDSDFE